ISGLKSVTVISFTKSALVITTLADVTFLETSGQVILILRFNSPSTITFSGLAMILGEPSSSNIGVLSKRINSSFEHDISIPDINSTLYNKRIHFIIKILVG